MSISTDLHLFGYEFVKYHTDNFLRLRRLVFRIRTSYFILERRVFALNFSREIRHGIGLVSGAGRQVTGFVDVFFRPEASAEAVKRNVFEVRQEQDARVGNFLLRVEALDNLKEAEVLEIPVTPLPTTIRLVADALDARKRATGLRDPALLELYEDVSAYATDAEDGVLLKLGRSKEDRARENYLEVDPETYDGINIALNGALNRILEDVH